MNISVRHLTRDDVSLMDAMLATFGRAFNDPERYTGSRPSDEYLKKLLSGESFIALVAMKDLTVIGALAAYELRKFEQETSEIYIYDLAVDDSHRRQGVASSLIKRLQRIARDRGAGVIFVQADTDPDDEPAIALYTKLGTREDVLHFDISVEDNHRDNHPHAS